MIYNNLTKTLKWENYEKKYGKKISNGVWSQESGKKISNGIIAQNIAPSEKARIVFVQSDILRGISGTISYIIDNDDDENEEEEVDKDKDNKNRENRKENEDIQEQDDPERKSRFHSVTISRENEDDKSNEKDERDKRDASEEDDVKGKR